MQKKNKGFTLVELIVVLVILAILAAILVPALLGYLDIAKDRQNIINAKNILTATQTKLTDAYAAETDLSKIQKKEEDWSGTDFAKEILETADDDPYMALIGVGNLTDVQDGKLPKHDAYTVYFAMYWDKYESAPIFFDGSKWSSEYPWKGDGDKNNYFMVNGEMKHMSFFFIADKYGKSNKWEHLKVRLKESDRNKYW